MPASVLQLHNSASITGNTNHDLGHLYPYPDIKQAVFRAVAACGAANKRGAADTSGFSSHTMTHTCQPGRHDMTACARHEDCAWTRNVRMTSTHNHTLQAQQSRPSHRLVPVRVPPWNRHRARSTYMASLQLCAVELGCQQSPGATLRQPAQRHTLLQPAQHISSTNAKAAVSCAHWLAGLDCRCCCRRACAGPV